jgi:hypothetical protein
MRAAGGSGSGSGKYSVCALYVTLAGNFRGTNSCNLIHFSTFFYSIMTDWRQTTLPRFFHQHQTTEQTIQGSTSGVNPKVA